MQLGIYTKNEFSAWVRIEKAFSLRSKLSVEKARIVVVPCKSRCSTQSIRGPGSSEASRFKFDTVEFALDTTTTTALAAFPSTRTIHRCCTPEQVAEVNAGAKGHLVPSWKTEWPTKVLSYINILSPTTSTTSARKIELKSTCRYQRFRTIFSDAVGDAIRHLRFEQLLKHRESEFAAIVECR